MTEYMEFDPTVPDLRCGTCRQHRYMVLCYNEESHWYWMHTHIDRPQPLITEHMMIHKWNARSINWPHPPSCVGSFRTVIIRS